MTKKDPNELIIKCHGKEDGDKKLADTCLNPVVDAALLVRDLKKSFDSNLMDILMALEEENKKVAKGDMSSMERMLVSQINMLHNIFANMTRRTMATEYVSQTSSYSKIALKAQNQCRQSILALAELKNPKQTTFIKNQATNQQVNFNSEKNNQNESNELLSEEHHAPMDITGTATTSGANQELATVEA